MAIYSNDELTKLYEKTYPNVYAVAYSIVKNEHDACDLAQETYLSAFTNIEKLEDETKFDKWVVQIAANKCKDFLRKKKPTLFSQFDTEETDYESEIVDNSDTYNPEKLLDDKEVKKIVKDILYSLPEDQRLCVVLYYGQDLKISEIADALGVSESTVKSRLSYAKKKIKQQVEEYEKKGTKLYSMSALAFFPLIKQAFGSGLFATKIPAVSISAAGVAKGAKVAIKKVGKFAVKKVVAAITAATVAIGGITAAVLLKPDPKLENVKKEEPKPMVWSGYGIESHTYTRRFEITLDELNDLNISGHLEVSHLYEKSHDTDFTGKGEKKGKKIIYKIIFEEPAVLGSIPKYEYKEMELAYDTRKDQFSFKGIYDVDMERVSAQKPETLFLNEKWQGVGEDGFYNATKTKNHNFELKVYKMTETEIKGEFTVSYNETIDHSSKFKGRGYERDGVIYYEVLLETPRIKKTIITTITVESFWLKYDIEKETFEIPTRHIYSVVMEK